MNIYGLQQKRKRIAEAIKKTAPDNLKRIRILEKARRAIDLQIEKQRVPRKTFLVINGKGKQR